VRARFRGRRTTSLRVYALSGEARHAPPDKVPARFRRQKTRSSFLDPREASWVEDEDKRLPLTPVNPTANGEAKRRTHKPPRGIDAVAFSPANALLDKAMGRAPKTAAPKTSTPKAGAR
jgi:hypothetical protein